MRTPSSQGREPSISHRHAPNRSHQTPTKSEEPLAGTRRMRQPLGKLGGELRVCSSHCAHSGNVSRRAIPDGKSVNRARITAEMRALALRHPARLEICSGFRRTYCCATGFVTTVFPFERGSHIWLTQRTAPTPAANVPASASGTGTCHCKTGNAAIVAPQTSGDDALANLNSDCYQSDRGCNCENWD